MPEFMLVKFSQKRRVLVDGTEVGDTNVTLMLDRGDYEVTLSGSGYSPEAQDVLVNGTSSSRPCLVEFQVASAAPKRGAKSKAKPKAGASRAAKKR
jgi:hypothetical protein